MLFRARQPGGAENAVIPWSHRHLRYGSSTRVPGAKTMTVETVASIAARVGGRVEGDATRQIAGVADVRRAGATELSFIRDASFASLASTSAAGALLVTEVFETDTTQIVVDNAHAAFAKIALVFHPAPKAAAHQIHPTAQIEPSAEIESPVRVDANVVIGAGCKIAAGTSIGAGTVLGERVCIGRDCSIYPRVVVYPGVEIGDEVILHSGVVLGTDGFGYVVEADGTRLKFPQLGGLEIGDRVEIGANSTVDRGALNATSIGAGTKIDNLCHIAHNCQIGRDCGISALSALAGGATLGDRVVLGGHVTSVGNIKIDSDVVIGGNSGVTGSVEGPGMYFGLPLLPRRTAARVLVLLGRLPEMATEIKELRRRLESKS